MAPAVVDVEICHLMSNTLTPRVADSMAQAVVHEVSNNSKMAPAVGEYIYIYIYIVLRLYFLGLALADWTWCHLLMAQAINKLSSGES